MTLRTLRALPILLLVAIAATPAAAQEEATTLDDVKAVARAAFRAALEPSEERGFQLYLALVHPDRKTNDRVVEDIRRHTWKRFRAGCRQFLADVQHLTFEIDRARPPEPGPDAEKIKVFFRALHEPDGGGPKRYPAPMDFRRQGDRWTIWFNAL